MLKKYLSSGVVLAILAVLFLSPQLGRPLWFDEALTILNFVMTPHLADVYWNYAIPNNHILFSLLLRLEAEGLWAMGLGVPELAWRAVSLLSAAIALTVMYRVWTRRCGRLSTLFVLIGFIGAPAFAIYATAVRGYMLGFLTVLLAFEAGRRFMTGRRIYLFWYALAALAAVGTIPSDLLALGAAALLVVPRQWRDRNWRRWALLVAVPPLMFLVFYGPLWPQLLHHIALKEGWPNGGRAMLLVYVGFVLPMLPLLWLAAGGGRLAWRRGAPPRTVGAILVMLGPLLAVPLLHPYPFPRTFFVWWPLWLYLTAAGLHRLGLWMSWSKWDFRAEERGRKASFVIIGLILLSFAAVLYLPTRNCGAIISGGELDDYFRPYYIVTDRDRDREYHPDQTVRLAREQAADGWIYASFAADPYPLLYYGLLQNMPADQWRFDGPRGRVASLDGCRLVVLRYDEKPDEVAAKLGVKKLHPVAANGYHRLYRPTAD